MASFRGKRAFLSNFYAAPLQLGDYTFPTVEHAYVFNKTLDEAERMQVLLCATPGEAKRLGRKLTIRPDWNDVKVTVMAALLFAKFYQHPDLRAQLLATGDEELVEENAWGDTFWGVCHGRGQNQLGRLLMHVRTILRREAEPRESVP